MTFRQYDIAQDIGYNAAIAATIDLEWDTADTFDDDVFPDAFDEAMQRLPSVPAPDIAEAVHDGIRVAWNRFMEPDLL